MTEDDEQDGRGRLAWIGTALPAVMLVLGVALGILISSVGGSDSGGDSGSDRSSGDPSSTGPSTAVVVPDSCLEAAGTVREATSAIRGGLDAVREFRADDILELLDRLEDLDQEAREQAATCTGTQVTDAGTPTPSGAPETSAPETSDPEESQTPAEE